MTDSEMIELLLNDVAALGSYFLCFDKENKSHMIRTIDICDLIVRQKKEIEQYKARISNDTEYTERIETENRKLKLEIERLQGCVKSEDEVREIMESEMENAFDLLFSDHLKRAMKLSREHTILDFVEWLLSLFPEDKPFTTISKFTVKQKYKEMMGEKHGITEENH